MSKILQQFKNIQSVLEGNEISLEEGRAKKVDLDSIEWIYKTKLTEGKNKVKAITEIHLESSKNIYQYFDSEFYEQVKEEKKVGSVDQKALKKIYSDLKLLTELWGDIENDIAYEIWRQKRTQSQEWSATLNKYESDLPKATAKWEDGHVVILVPTDIVVTISRKTQESEEDDGENLEEKEKYVHEKGGISFGWVPHDLPEPDFTFTGTKKVRSNLSFELSRKALLKWLGLTFDELKENPRNVFPLKNGAIAPKLVQDKMKVLLKTFKKYAYERDYFVDYVASRLAHKEGTTKIRIAKKYDLDVKKMKPLLGKAVIFGDYTDSNFEDDEWGYTVEIPVDLTIKKITNLAEEEDVDQGETLEEGTIKVLNMSWSSGDPRGLSDISLDKNTVDVGSYQLDVMIPLAEASKITGVPTEELGYLDEKTVKELYSKIQKDLSKKVLESTFKEYLLKDIGYRYGKKFSKISRKELLSKFSISKLKIKFDSKSSKNNFHVGYGVVIYLPYTVGLEVAVKKENQ